MHLEHFPFLRNYHIVIIEEMFIEDLQSKYYTVILKNPIIK